MFRSSRDIFVPKVEKVKLNIEDKKQVYGCDLCTDGGWTSETEVEIHRNKKHINKLFYHVRKNENICYVCVQGFANKEEVIRHIKAEHLLSSESSLRVEREIFICDKCSAIFFSKDNLVVHVRYVHMKAQHLKFLKCPLCSKNILPKTIPAHFYMHNIQSVSTCRICLIKQNSTEDLRKHLESHPFHLKCDMCYFDTNKVDLFQNHIKVRHKNCDAPSEDYERFFIPKKPSYLRLQRVTGLRGIRLNNDVHICVLCREICVGEEEMKIHVTEHFFKKEVIISYLCPKCPEAFTNKVLLKYHMFKVKHDFDAEQPGNITNHNNEAAEDTASAFNLNEAGPSTSNSYVISG